MNTARNHSIHDVLIPNQMCPVMRSMTSDYIVFETLPFLDYYMGWSMVCWHVTLLDDGACIVVEKWGGTNPTGERFREDRELRSDHEFESLRDALMFVNAQRSGTM